MFSPAVFTSVRADDIEHVTEVMVDVRRDRTPAQVKGEYRRWSGVFAGAIPMMSHGPRAVDYATVFLDWMNIG